MDPEQTGSILPELLKKNEAAILRNWLTGQAQDRSQRGSNLSDDVLRNHSATLLNTLQQALQGPQDGASVDLESPRWQHVREALSDISIAETQAGSTPTQAATFVFSLKPMLFELLQHECGGNPQTLVREVLNVSSLLDTLGLFTTAATLKSREDLIIRQQAEMLELSTPVVKLWDGVLGLPLIGTLDSERTQVVMDSLLDEIVRTGATIAIIDITGVPTVDTLVAQHLLKTVAAARLMGAECIISGIRPQIASTIVHLGVELGNVATKATLADAFKIALRRIGLQVTSTRSPAAGAGARSGE